MGIRSYIRDRKQVKASRAGNGAAAASEFVPPRKPPRPGAGAPTGSLPKPKRESGNPPSSTPPKLSPTEKNMHKKPDYKENKRISDNEKNALPHVYDEKPAYLQPTKWPEGDGDKRSPIDRI
jgi:hypothetical protein